MRMPVKIFEIKRFAIHDGDGIRTTVFFKGCPLQCLWCHNPEGIDSKPQLAYYSQKCISCGACVKACPYGAHSIYGGKHIFHREKCLSCGKCENVCFGKALQLYGKDVTVDALLPVLLEDKEFFNRSGGGVTLSGGECLLQADFCEELLKKLKENGVSTAIDTCGFVPRKAIEQVMPYTDVFLYDIKAIDDAVHKKCTGQSNQIILKNLKYIDECGKKTEIRIPYVPCYNDGEIDKIVGFVKTLKHVTKIRVLPYHNLAGSKYESLGLPNTIPPILPSSAEIDKANALCAKISV